MTKPIRTTVAALVVLAFVATWLAMEWAGRSADTLLLLAAAAIVIGAAYHLWGAAMDDAVDAVNDFDDSGTETDTDTDS